MWANYLLRNLEDIFKQKVGKEMRILNVMGMVLGRKKYLILFISMIVIFSFVYIFEWNLILLPDFYIRTDLWTLLNILFLVVISTLSGLSITLSVFNLKMKMTNYKKRYGIFAVIPAFFTSACPGCAPLILSFTSTTFAIGLSIAQFGFAVKIFTILILLGTFLYMCSTVSKCKINFKKEGNKDGK